MLMEKVIWNQRMTFLYLENHTYENGRHKAQWLWCGVLVALFLSNKSFYI